MVGGSTLWRCENAPHALSLLCNGKCATFVKRKSSADTSSRSYDEVKIRTWDIISAIAKIFPFIVKRLIFTSAEFEWFYVSPFRFAFPDGKLWVFTLIKCREADKEKCDKSTKNDFSCNLQFAIIHRARVCVCAGAIASILWSFSWSFFSCCKALLNAVAPSRQCWLKKSLQSDYECTLSPCQFNGRNIKKQNFLSPAAIGSPRQQHRNDKTFFSNSIHLCEII